MSQTSASNKSTGHPESQMSTSEKSFGKKESQEGSPEKSSTEEKPPVGIVNTTSASFRGENLLVDSAATLSSDQKPPTSTQYKFVEQGPLLDTKEMAGEQELPRSATEVSSDQEPPTSTQDKFGEQGPLRGTTELSGDQEVPRSTTEVFRDPKPPTSIQEKFNEQGPLRGTTKLSGDQEPPRSTTEVSSDPYSPTTTQDKLGEQGSLRGTKEMVGDQEPLRSTTEVSSDPEPPTSPQGRFGEQGPLRGTTELAGDQEPPSSTTEVSSYPELPTSTQNKFGEQKSLMGTTDILPDKKLSQVDSKDKSLVDPEAQTDTTCRTEPSTTTSDKSGDQKSPEDSSKQVSQDSTTAGITEKQELQMDEVPNVRQRQVLRAEAGHQLPDKPEKIFIEEKPTTGYNWLIGLIASALVVAVLYSFFSSKGQPPAHQDSELEIFLKEFTGLKKDFPGQYEGLWFRSEKLLKRHLNTSHPSAPSIIILTAARDGEQTLLCVSQRLAKVYADSFHARWLMVHGPSKSEYDSATSKMQIDEELSAGFHSNSRAAVLYRLETLPSGSLLILYKYCDHENAAFKNVALVLTVLLDEPSLEQDLSFTEVEEKVKDFLWERFAYSEVSAHNEMDVDKLSGVWSRISHVVLPVLPVGSIESGSCPGIKG